MEWLFLLFVVLIVAIAAGISDSKKSKKNASVGEKDLKLKVNISTDDYSDRWRQRELKSKRKAFDDIVEVMPLSQTVKNALWREFKNEDHNFNRTEAFEILLKGIDWEWPWLDESRDLLKKSDDLKNCTDIFVYEGPPTAPRNSQSLTELLKVAEMRTWLKKHNQYPSPAPRKREEFEAIYNNLPWSDLEPFAMKVFDNHKDQLNNRYEKERVRLLVNTLSWRAHQEREFERYQEYGQAVTVISDPTLLAAKEAIRLSKEQKRPLPPFYPGDNSRLHSINESLREQAHNRIEDAIFEASKAPETYSEKIYKAYWVSASKAAANYDFAVARQWFKKAGMALHGLPGHDSEKQDLKDDSADALRKDPAYIVSIHEIRKLVNNNPGLMQKDIYKMLSYSKEDISQGLYFAAENGDIIRTKSGNRYKLSLDYR